MKQQKLNTQTEKVYCKVRKICKNYLNSEGRNKFEVIRYLSYAETFFRFQKDKPGILFTKKNQLRCILATSFWTGNYAPLLFVERRVINLIQKARNWGLMRPSYSKLYIQVQMNFASYYIRKRKPQKALYYIRNAFSELRTGQEEFPTYGKFNRLESELAHLKGAVLATKPFDKLHVSTNDWVDFLRS